MALRGAIASLAQGGPFTVTRKTAGTRTLGRYTAGGTTTFQIVASVQPVAGAELQDLPEGQRTDEMRVIYTTTELRTRKSGSEPDVVTHDGEPWTVVKVERFDAFGETHYRAYASRTGRP